MDFLTEQQRIRMKVSDLIDEGREKNRKPSPLVEYQSGKVVEMLGQIKRKKAETDEKKYNQIRQAFDQNYAKIYPFKPSE